MRIVIAGDLVPGGDALKEGIKIDSETWLKADFRIANLESPLSSNVPRAGKPTVYAPPEAARLLRQLKVSCVSLSNNHIGDLDDCGVADTINALRRVQIGWFGAGLSLTEARKPYWFNNDLCVLAYTKDYMKEVEYAGRFRSGVAPLRKDLIFEDLGSIPEHSQAIVLLHWGREQVLFPPIQDVNLARELMAHPKVALVAGSHAHRVQGIVGRGKRRAYMCIGNFVFPNFFQMPLFQMVYSAPEAAGPSERFDVTRYYHRVYGLTYKKWKTANRISLLIEYNAETKRVRHIPLIQDDNHPRVKEMTGLRRRMCNARIAMMSTLYKLPATIYVPLEKANLFFWRVRWVKYFWFMIRQISRKEGVRGVAKRISSGELFSLDYRNPN